jgi:predicted small secreted protein
MQNKMHLARVMRFRVMSKPTSPDMKTNNKLLQIALLAIAAIAVSGALSSCKTVKGFGGDVEKLGSKIEQKADQNTHY